MRLGSEGRNSDGVPVFCFVDNSYDNIKKPDVIIDGNSKNSYDERNDLIGI